MRGKAMLSKEEAHKATGMKVSEIVEVEAIDGGYRVHTHDGQHVDLDSGEVPAEEKKAAASRSRKA